MPRVSALRNASRCSTLPRLLAIALAVLASGGVALAQAPLTTLRGDEVGPRFLELDEEGFLNILSFRLPLETIQPWLAAGSGFRGAYGSTRRKDLWYDQTVKFTGDVSERFVARALAHGGVDFDTDYLLFEAALGYRVTPEIELFVPALIDTTEKKGMDAGLGARYRDPDAGIDYAQISWLRADFLFDTHHRYRDAEMRSAADTLELQGQAELGWFGKLSAKIAWQTPAELEIGDIGERTKFQRLSCWLLHRLVLDESSLLYSEIGGEMARERRDRTTPASTVDEFRGHRQYLSPRFEYQRSLDERGVSLIRAGVQLVYYTEDEDTPQEPESVHKLLRRELILYGGYRFPLGETVSLETDVYLDRMAVRNRYPYSRSEDGSFEDTFQGKISFFFRWSVSEKAEVTISPSFELDTLGWGGGLVQATVRL